MTIAFPRAMPDELTTRLVGLSFKLQPMIEINPLRSGRQIAADLGPALWFGEYSSGVLSAARFGVVRAWIDTLLSTQEFFGFDKFRERPLGGLPVGFTGACTVSSFTPPFALTLGSLPFDFILAPGDYVSFNYNSGATRALHRIVAGGTSSVIDGSLTLEVRPAIRSGLVAGAAANVYRAAARMIILPNSYDENITPPDFGTVSFKAIQTL
jgi:hypothetical protein